MRLFFAVELPANARAALAAARAPLANADPGGYRWVHPSLLHVTLAFLGEQPPGALASLQQTAAETAARWHGGTIGLTLGPFGAFGPARAPRVLWAGLAGDVAALARLQGALAARLRRAGVALDDRPFRPHITLARRRDGAPSPPPPLPWPPAAGPPVAVQVDHFSLFESQLAGAGPRYTIVDRFPFPFPFPSV